MEMTLGERIRKARKGKMTQAELAEKVGVHEITVRRWELGERIPDVQAIGRMSQILGVSTSELMGENNSIYIPPAFSETENEPNMAYWGGVIDNAKRAVKNGENLNLIYSLLADAAGTVKAAIA